MKKELKQIIYIVIAACLSALGLYVFVYPASFAPAGVDGIATMLYDITGINAGYFSLLLNLPLLVAASFVLNKRYVAYTVLFTVVSSGLLILFEAVNFYQYNDINGTGYLVSALFAGVILGVRTGIMLKIGGSTGGIDVIAGIIQRKTTYRYVEKLISILGYGIIALSFVIYRNLNSILLSAVQIFVAERASTEILRDNRNAVEFKIITHEPDKIKDVIIGKLKHGATVIECEGAFTEKEKYMLITVVNNRQIGEFLKIMEDYPNSFIYYSDVLGVSGNFRYRKDDKVK